MGLKQNPLGKTISKIIMFWVRIPNQIETCRTCASGVSYYIVVLVENTMTFSELDSFTTLKY